MPQERLQKILSAAGVASRRVAEALITEGRVRVNGEVASELGAKADPDVDRIEVDGRRLHTAVPRRYILLYKPVHYVTTRSDPQRRPTVLTLLGQAGQGLYPVGRLDFDSEGLILLTNDGELADRLTHPRHEVPRTYEVRVFGVPTTETLRRLEGGVPLDGRRTAPARVRIIESFTKSSGEQSLLQIVIHEGRNRQVRRMCQAVGLPVITLARTSIGTLTDRRMKPGMYRELRPAEVQQLRADAGLAAGPAPAKTRTSTEPQAGVRFGHAPTPKHITRTVGGKPRVTKKAARKRVSKKITLKEYARAVAPKRGPRKRTK
ncbi:pseudouridine synthase [Luteitalea sp.]|uniref:pseudouridine synthase n=1 Tax=Luteitalea sp. TaxID=2004800 RepID=UPI000AD7BCF0|nr:pseudouridine synthase [Luteitalea sp.]